MLWFSPLAITLLASTLPLAGQESGPGGLAVSVGGEESVPRVFTLPLRVPEEQLKALLRAELGKRKLLRNFQVVTSKFSHGRVVLDSLNVTQGPRPGTVRFEAHARLRFDRKQLGVRWRGFKSHKKWYKKSAKDAAKVRVTCVVTLGQLVGSKERLGAALTNIRVKIVSRLHPARGLTARFDVKDRQFGWTPEGGLFDHLEIASLRIAGVEQGALRLEIQVSKAPR